MEQAKKIGGQVLIVVVGVIVALKVQEYLNKAKLTAPAASKTA